MLGGLSEGLANRVVHNAPPDAFDYVLTVLPTARHPQAVVAHFPSISTDSSLSFNCEQFPSATLTAALAALACMPQLQSLDVCNIPLVAGTPSNTTRRTPSAVLRGILEACMSPMHVFLRFGPGELYSGLMAVVVSALKGNTALRNLTVSKPDCRRQENFDPISLAGVEELTWLESLTLTTDDVDCLQNQHWLLSPNLSRLTNLTALRFAGCLLQNPKDVATALPSLRNLQVGMLAIGHAGHAGDVGADGAGCAGYGGCGGCDRDVAHDGSFHDSEPPCRTDQAC